jgi:hypothetical protein
MKTQFSRISCLMFRQLTPALAAITLVIGASFPSARAQVIVSAYFGWDQTQLTPDLQNRVDAFNTGARANNNISINGTANVFTLSFVDGLNTGNATFTVSDNYGTAGDLRQFANGLLGPANTAEDLTITLTTLTNISALTLNRVQITGGTTSNYEATLPGGTTSTSFNTNTLNATWTSGQTLTISTVGTATAFNVQGYKLTATVIPEPGTVVLLCVAFLALVGAARIRKAAGASKL